METKENFTVADAIVKELVKAGVKAVYGIVSIHNLPIFDAILREGSIRIATARGESGAVNMADAHARATGQLGVVITSTGSGAGNAAGSIVEAWNAGTPLLHITGEAADQYIGTNQRYIHEAKDQNLMMEGAGKKSYLLKRPKQTSALIHQAIREAFAAPAGPVTVNIPNNFQAQIIPNNDLIPLQEIGPEQDQVELPQGVIEQVAKAKRPVLWAGSGVIASGADAELKDLVEKIEPAVLTSEGGKGVISENHPLCIGPFSATPQVANLLEKSDLLISVGTRFRDGETFDWTLPIPKEHINIDLDPQAFNRNNNTTTTLIGDAKAVLQAMNEALEPIEVERKEAYLKEVKDIRQAVRDDLRAVIGPYAEIAKIMEEELSEETILITDVTIPGYVWGNKLVPIHKPRHYLHMAGGGIGQGLPMAIGAKIAQPEKSVVLIAGDGGFMVNANELITAIQEDTPVVILLFNDGGYGILRYYQDAAYGRRTAVDLKNPDFVMMAKSMGLSSGKVSSVEEFHSELTEALASEKPYLIEIDVEAVGILEYEDPEEYIATFRPHENPEES